MSVRVRRLALDRAPLRTCGVFIVSTLLLAGWVHAAENEESPPQAPPTLQPPKLAPLVRQIMRLFGGQPAPEEPAPAQGISEKDAIDSRVPKDAQIDAMWQASQQAIEQQNWKQAIDLIQKLLDLPEDAVVEQETGRWQSVRISANRRLGQLPATALADYERRQGGLARQQLQELNSHPDRNRLVDLATRYFHTEAGAEAAARLARWHFDSREFLPATRWNLDLLERGWRGTNDPAWRLQAAFAARQAGQSDLAKLLEGVLDAPAGTTVNLGGVSVSPSEWWEHAVQPSDTLATAREWHEFGGSLTRTAIATPGEPLLLAEFSQPLTTVPSIQEKLGTLMQDLADEGLPAIPALSPLVVGDLLVFRDLQGVRVVDINTGRTKWHTAEGISPERILGGAPNLAADPRDAWRTRVNVRQFQDDFQGGAAEMHPLASWLFRDAVNGFLSSDGKRLFVLEDIAVMTRNQSGYTGDGDGDTADAFGATWSSNRLSAYDLHSGRLEWTIGGPATEEAVTLPLAGSFFFGVPAVDRDELYVVVGTGQEIRLQALDPGTGLPRWSQLLAYSDTKIELDIARRWLSAPISIRDGVIVCPTTVGWLVAVDRTRHALAWAHRYWPRSEGESGEPGPQFLPHRSLQESWAVGAPVIDGGYVLFAPPDSDDLACLRLLDGQEAWTRPRNMGLFITISAPGRALIVSAEGLEAVETATGKSLWSTNWTAGDWPTGRGCIYGDTYALPLSSGEVWRVDCQTGKPAPPLPVPAGAPPLGNLIKVGNRFVSLGAEGCRVFTEKDRFLNRVAAISEHDRGGWESRVRLAELDLLERRPEVAIERLNQPAGAEWPHEWSEAQRDGLWSAWWMLVREEPGRALEALDQLEKLSRSADDRFRVETLRIAHFRESGQWNAVFQRCRALADSATEPRMVPRPEDEQIRVELSAWVRGQLEDLWAEAPEPFRESTTAELAQELDRVLQQPIDNWLPFTRWIDFHPLACRLHFALAEEYARAGMFSRAEGELESWEQHADPSVAIEAQWRMARLWQQFGLHADAEARIARWKSSRLSVRLHDGRDIADIVANWDSSEPTEFPVSADAVWQAHRSLAAERLTATYQAQTQELIPPLESPGLAGISMQIEPQEQRLSFQSRETGEWLWLAPLRGVPRSHGNEFAPYRFLGHRIVLLHRDVLQMISPIRKESVWSVAVADDRDSVGHSQRDLPTPLFDTSEFHDQMIFWNFRQAHQGRMAVCNPRAVAILGRRTLDVYNPGTGQLVWSHGNLPPFASVFGTCEVLFVIDTASEDVRAFRITDGLQLEIPDINQMVTQTLAVVDRDLIQVSRSEGIRLFQMTTGQTTIRRRHPQSGLDRWEISLRAGAQIGRLGERGLLVVHPAGRGAKQPREVEFIDLDSGDRTRFDPLPQLPDEDSLTPLIDRERVYLIVNHGQSNGYSYGDSVPSTRLHGTLVAWDRSSGTKLWQRKIDDQNLVLDRFEESPVILMLARSWNQVGQATYTTLHAQVLNKQTGAILHESRAPSLFSGFHGVRLIEPEHLLEVVSYNQRLRFVPTLSAPASTSSGP